MSDAEQIKRAGEGIRRLGEAFAAMSNQFSEAIIAMERIAVAHEQWAIAHGFTDLADYFSLAIKVDPYALEMWRHYDGTKTQLLTMIGDGDTE